MREEEEEEEEKRLVDLCNSTNRYIRGVQSWCPAVPDSLVLLVSLEVELATGNDLTHYTTLV